MATGNNTGNSGGPVYLPGNPLNYKTPEPSTDTPSINATGIAAWVFLIIVLVALASFSSTESLAAAFAYLILIVSILNNGLDAIGNWNNFITSLSNTGKNK